MNTREIQDWLLTQIGELLQVDPETLDIRGTFTDYGLSSRDLVSLSGELEELLGRRLSPTLAYEYPSILTLSRYLAEPAEDNQPALNAPSSTDHSNEPIAIIGIGCRFPGAKDPESFWQLLRDGVDMISEVPPDRWPKKAFYHPDPTMPGKAISYWGGFLDNIDAFDPFFFGISPVEAKHMDPQQRLLMELSQEALDDAGQSKENLDGTKTGVFIGISVNEYSHAQWSDPLMITSHSGTGSALSVAANRISYFFNFRGPSMAIDTACSSSLTAVHLACQSLRSGDCKMALAGGVNMILSPAHSIAFTKAGVLAPDGRCKTFDARADGYVRGEGGGLIVLKPLSAALADGDPVHAVILGSAMSQDGHTNGLMAPSQEAQETMLREACQAAGIAPGKVQYVEAHGTGTLLGDSMEAAALGAVIGAERAHSPCAIGSVKTNIGHLEAAAGIAGLIKVVLSIKHRTIPPSLHYHSPNPHIPFDALNLQVQNGMTSWPAASGPAIAGVSSFGFGGTNVHVVVREADPIGQEKEEIEQHDSTGSNYQLLPLSANSYENLQALAGTFQELLASRAISTKDICYAASTRRSQYAYRLAAIGESRQELSDSLQAFMAGEQHPKLFLASKTPDRQPKLAFVFSGQGGQWYGMGRELLKQEPVFFQTMERIDQAIQTHFGWSLMEELVAEQSESRLAEIDVVQPLIFAIQVALAALWQSWGITPDAVTGHSMGEVAAAHVAGILSLEDAIQVVCLRSQRLKSLSGRGCMLATELSPAQAEELLKAYKNDIAIAAINGPTSTVLSGDPEKMQVIMDSLERQNLFCRWVKVDVASHSPQIELLRPELIRVLDGLQPQAASIPFYSTVTGARGDELVFTADYWVNNLRQPVLFSAAIKQLLDSGHSVFMEIGPHPILLGSIQQSVQSPHRDLRLLPSLHREKPAQEVLLGTLGTLYTEGFSIAWKNHYPSPGKYVQLPPIPWQRQRYWLDAISTSSKNAWHRGQAEDLKVHPLLGDRTDLANSPSAYVWQTALHLERLRFLEDHEIEDEILLPAAAYIEMALQAAAETGLVHSHALSDFVFLQKMILQNGKPRSVQVLLSPEKEGNFLFSVYSRTTPKENWTLHASATFFQHQAKDDFVPSTGIQPEAFQQQSTSEFSAEEIYPSLQLRGIQYGPGFRGIEQVWSKENESLGHIRLPGSLQFDTADYQIHPALLDACLQVLAATKGASTNQDLYLPAGCKRIRFFSRPAGLLWSVASLQTEVDLAADSLEADIRLFDENNQIVAELLGFRLQRTQKSKRRLLSQQDTWLYHLQWQAQPASRVSTVTTTEKRNWLIFADEEGVGEELAKQLEAGGATCQLLLSRHLKNAAERAFPELIEQQLAEAGASFYGIIHLWSLSIPPQSSDAAEALNTMPLLGCNSVLYLVQALAKRFAGSPRLWLVTRGAQSVQSGDAVAVEQSALWGLGKVISFELPELKCVRIDLDPQQSDAESASLLFKQISIEDQEDQIAFRAEERFVARLLPYPQTRSGTPEVSLRADSTYLITGGLGGLGLTTAKWMAQRGARHLVLLGRSEPSPLARRVVDQLQQAGLEILVAQADVSDPAQLGAVLEDIQSRMPMLRGVVHAAGLLDDGALLNLDKERMKNVMAPKVEGTWNLHAATSSLPLDFFVLFSSAVSVLGSPGQGNYAAASAYLDAMAYFRRNQGLPAISINWGPWAEVGLAAEATERLQEQNASTQHLVKVITLDQGLEILEFLLHESAPQVLVLPFDLKNLLELYPTAAGMQFFAEVGGNDTHVARLYARPNLRRPYVAPRNEVERKLAELWQQTLHIDRVGIHDSFFELGGDSVLAVQILALARKSYGISINPQDAFQAFTIERLAEILEAEILKQIEAGKQSAHDLPAIPRRPPNSPILLSFPQQRQLFLEMLDRGTAINNLSVFMEIKGPLDLAALEQSANQILARHELLRSKFSIGQGLPAPEILDEILINIPIVDLQKLDEPNMEAAARRLAEKEVLQAFDLSQAPLIRLQLYLSGKEHYLLLVIAHHTIADGWSLGVFLQELMLFYQANTIGKSVQAPELPIQYADYAHWQTDEKRKEVLQASMSYWKKQLAGELPVLELPTDQERGARQTFSGGTHRFVLSKALTEALEELSRQEDATLFMTLLTAFFILLHRYSGQDEILIGTPIANRNLPELEPLIGVFINTLVLRTKLAGDPGFRELLQGVRKVCMDAYAHQNLPFEKLVEALKPKRDLSRTPLFQVVFNLQNSPLPKLEIAGLETTFLEIDRGVSQFDLTLMISKIEGQCLATVEYNKDLFHPATISRMFQAFHLLLEAALTEADGPISRLQLVPPEEKQQLMYGLNQPQLDFPREKCMHQLFEAQVEQTPNAIAIIYGQTSLRYRELNRCANALARQLLELGLGPDFRVGILMKKSLEIVEALLGVLKAGGTYVPIHPFYPTERVQFMLKDAGVQVLLTNVDTGPLEVPEIHVVYLKEENISSKSDYSNPQTPVSPKQLAYINYTSGSTGKPKGVMVQHSSLVNFLWSMRTKPGIKQTDVLMAVTSISFDIAALELYLPLITGATVVLASEEMTTQPALIGAAIQRHQVTMMQATPATWQLLLETGWAGQPGLKALCGGDVLTRKLADQILERVGSLWNMYGPTETTIWSSISHIEKGDSPITIGQPIGNTQFYILDRYLQAVPIGVIGELYIGGDGLARGYLNQALLTEEKFIPDFISSKPGARLYRTGDHARYLADYSIEILGRIDDQVKLHGHRMELGEISAVLVQHPLVRDAIVIIRTENSGDKRLVAYFVPKRQPAPEAGALREFIRKKLPAYMSPAFFICLDSLPLTPNGKIDRKALPVPEDVHQLSGYVAPRNEEEQILAEIWQSALSLEQVGIHDNFFDLGGASIQSLQIVAKANMYGFRLSVEQLFEYQTIAELAALIKEELQ